MPPKKRRLSLPQSTHVSAPRVEPTPTAASSITHNLDAMEIDDNDDKGKKKVSQENLFPAPAQNVYALWCLIDGDSTAFQIKPRAGDNGNDLRKCVWVEKKNRLSGIDPSDLVVSKVTKPIEVEPDETLSERLRLLGADVVSKLRTTEKVSERFPERPAENYLHIFVTLPPTERLSKWIRMTGSSSPRPTDISAALLQRWSKPDLIPLLPNLAAYLDTPFEENEKVPLSRGEMMKLTSQVDLLTMCSEDNVQQLFRSSEEQEAELIWTVLKPAILLNAPDSAGTEMSFISFWDDNIRKIISTIIFSSTWIRDSNRNTSTGLLRPDSGLLIEGICPFRGEEKPPKFNGRHPKDELKDKLTWTYDPAPYITGYYAVGPELALVAILPSLAVVELARINLSFRSQRIRNLMRIIRMCCVIQSLRKTMGDRHSAEFLPMKRENGTVIEIGSDLVRKQYNGSDRVERVRHLRNIYSLLQAKRVPNVDAILNSDEDHPIHGSFVFLQPKGIDRYPAKAQEVQEAVVCVLKALTVLHGKPTPLFHRDIRWPNVIRDSGDQSKWFLIDWDDATTPPTRAVRHLDPDSHPPSVFHDNHGSEVDIWGVGKLILESRFVPGMSAGMIAIGERMIKGEIYTADEGLDDIRSLGSITADMAPS